MHTAGEGAIQLNRFLIAVVEDDQGLLEALESLLDSAGYDVLLYSSAEAFLISGRLPHIDCLITDIGLPGMSGIELLQEVRSRTSNLTIILITALSGHATTQAALASGASQVFLKPLDNAALLDSIKTVR